MTESKEVTVKQIEEAKANLIKLCRDFYSEERASDRISLLTDITSGCFAPNDEEGNAYEVKYVIETNYRINLIMIFLAALQEKIERIKTFEHRLKKPEYACY